MKGFYIRHRFTLYDNAYGENLYLPSKVTYIDPRWFHRCPSNKIILKSNWKYQIDGSEENYYIRYCRTTNYKIGKPISLTTLNRWITKINEREEMPDIGGWIKSEEEPVGIDNFLSRLPLEHDVVIDKRMFEIEGLWKPRELILLDTI